MIAIKSLWKPQFLLVKAEILIHKIVFPGLSYTFFRSNLSVLEAEIYHFRIMHLIRYSLFYDKIDKSNKNETLFLLEEIIK